MNIDIGTGHDGQATGHLDCLNGNKRKRARPTAFFTPPHYARREGANRSPSTTAAPSTGSRRPEDSEVE